MLEAAGVRVRDVAAPMSTRRRPRPGLPAPGRAARHRRGAGRAEGAKSVVARAADALVLGADSGARARRRHDARQAGDRARTRWRSCARCAGEHHMISSAAVDRRGRRSRSGARSNARRCTCGRCREAFIAGLSRRRMAGDRGLRRLLPDRGAGRAIVRADRGQPFHRARPAAAAVARLSARARGAGVHDGMPYAEVIGDPIAQSKSPLIHGFWLDAARHRCATIARACDARRACRTISPTRRADPDWRGCNVTMPHKQAVHRSGRRSRRHPRQRSARSTRSSAQTDGALIGTNTDAAGFLAPARRARPRRPRTVAVVGAGGAARAVLFALARRSGSGT